MLTTNDLYIDAVQGSLFVRTWRPTAAVGTDTPIVLFHDSWGCVELWRDFPARLAAATQRQVIAYDRLGFGRSGTHPGRLQPDFVHAEANGDFHAVKRGLAFENFIAFGHSVGGGMAVACAAAHGGSCVALITESAQAFVEDRTLSGIREAKGTFAQAGQMERLRKYHGDKADWVLGAWVDTWLSPAFAAWSLDDDLSRVHSPTLALHGDRDEFGSIIHPQRIAGMTGGQAVIMENCGHVPHREQCDAVIGAVTQWLSDNGAGGRRTRARL
jgi:pimeloyl-ACP methyl ester carboxylesterase